MHAVTQNTTGTLVEPKPGRSIIRRILKWVARGILGLVALLVLLIISGIVYESVMAGGDAQRFPAPGQLVTVGDHQMHLNCVGEGSPTVIFEAGFGATSDAWALVHPEVGSITRSCSYDRAGIGWSEPSSTRRTQEQIALDLHDLLAVANVQPPYILVGHSMGGKSIRLFAEQYPDEVAGLIFVDARHESVEPVGRTPEQNAQDGAAYESSLNFYRILRQTGIVRLFGLSLSRSLKPSLNAVPDDVVYRMAIFSVRETILQTMIAEGHESMANDDQLRAAQLRDGLPVIVLTADSSLELIENWELGQTNLAALSTNSQWTIVENSTHDIQIDQPQAVIEAIEDVLAAAQTGQPLE
jgi:pimeloyl-ACP methyl ester carboxylesterase